MARKRSLRVVAGVTLWLAMFCGHHLLVGQSSSTGTNPLAGSGTDASKSRSNSDPLTAAQNRRTASLFIAGSVVLSDGSPPPMGAVIERVCSGQVVREAYVAPDGNFSFPVGTANLPAMDSLDTAGPIYWDPGGTSSPAFPVAGNRLAVRLDGCELRATLGGYRSNSLVLSVNQNMGTVNAGTLVLYPAVKVKGTVVSVTNLAAPKSARKALEQGEKEIAAKRFDRAEKRLNDAVAAYPAYAAAWYRMGQLFEIMQRREEARIALRKALQADANFVGPYIELARLAAQEKDWAQTADLTGNALKLNPLDFPFGHYLDALANFNLNRLEEAEKSARMLERLDARHRFAEIYLLLANLLRRKSDFAGEAEQLRRYLACRPNADDAAQIRARLQRISG